MPNPPTCRIPLGFGGLVCCPLAGKYASDMRDGLGLSRSITALTRGMDPSRKEPVAEGGAQCLIMRARRMSPTPDMKPMRAGAKSLFEWACVRDPYLIPQ
jgi:hypothetical protein